MPTELRAALRDIAENLTDATLDADPEADAGNHEEAHEYLHLAIGPAVKRLRALADAPPTVAELMPVTWADEKRTDSEARCRLDVGPVTIEVRGYKRATDLTWAWQWWLPHAHTVRTAPDEASAKATALAALDEWIAEIVDARRAVTL